MKYIINSPVWQTKVNKSSASYAKLEYKFRNDIVKLYTTQNIKFNRMCKKHNIIPKYVQVTIKINTKEAMKAKSSGEQIQFNTEIKEIYNKKQ